MKAKQRRGLISILFFVDAEAVQPCFGVSAATYSPFISAIRAVLHALRLLRTTLDTFREHSPRLDSAPHLERYTRRTSLDAHFLPCRIKRLQRLGQTPF
jgi:hypothetical protein